MGRQRMSADDKSCCRFSVRTESFAQSLTCFLPPSVTFCQGNVHLFLFDPRSCNSPLHCKAARQTAMCATQISACLAVALSTFCRTHWPHRKHIDLSKFVHCLRILACSQSMAFQTFKANCRRDSTQKEDYKGSQRTSASSETP